MEQGVTKKKGFWYELRRHRVLYLMILPTVVYFCIFQYIPMAGVYLAFVDYNIKDGFFGSPFVGLRNFKTLFSTGVMQVLLRNTLLYNLAFLILGTIFKVFLAILLNRVTSKVLKKSVQTISLLPYFVSYVIVATFAYLLFNSATGQFTLLMRTITGNPNFATYSEPGVWPFIIVFVEFWKSAGYGMVIYLAALTNIDDTYYEAAKIDGATVFQQIRFITVPMLMPTVITLTIMSLGGIVRGQMELFYQLVGTNGQLYGVTDILDTYVFRSLQGNFDVGRSTAIGLFQSLFGLAVVLIVNSLIRHYNKDYALF